MTVIMRTRRNVRVHLIIRDQKGIALRLLNVVLLSKSCSQINDDKRRIEQDALNISASSH
jgi:hypothetical protein